MHWLNGFPVNPEEQTHWGVWLTTWHSALIPHIPGQGSLHFWLMHAKWLAHSLLLTHSGLQLGGTPMYSGKHEQEGLSPDALHWEYGPHGVGWHGFAGGNACGGATKINK